MADSFARSQNLKNSELTESSCVFQTNGVTVTEDDSMERQSTSVQHVLVIDNSICVTRGSGNCSIGYCLESAEVDDY